MKHEESKIQRQVVNYLRLELRQCGGLVFAVPNGGNVEYLKDEYNCLFYPAGKIEKAIEQIERICIDKELQEILFENGQITAKNREWKSLEKEIISLYEL